jgi:5-methylcytosine-specific restriction endonuclease McrA
MPALYTQPTPLEGKTCSDCGKYFPSVATSFFRKEGRRYEPRCKNCYMLRKFGKEYVGPRPPCPVKSKRERKPKVGRRPRVTFPIDAAGGKTCLKCGTYFPEAAASFYRKDASRLEPACKACYQVAKLEKARAREVQPRGRTSAPREAGKRRPPVPAIDGNGGKTCVRCGTYYDDARRQFYLTREGRPVGARCKSCVLVLARLREGTSYNPGRAHQRYLEMKKDAGAYEALKRRVIERRRRLAEAPEFLRQERERRKRWRERNPEKEKATKNRRRAAKMGSERHFTDEEWRALCARYDNVCLACGERGPLSADHVVPLSCGGGNGIENIQPLCRLCNCKKYTKTIDYRPRWQ